LRHVGAQCSERKGSGHATRLARIDSFVG
jgi:hypothetical protein